MTRDNEIRHDAEAHREGCSCTRRDAFDRETTIANLVARGHDHIDWPNQTDAYVQSYANEMDRIYSRRAEVATIPLEATVHPDAPVKPPRLVAPLFNTLEARATRRNTAARKRR